MKISEIRKNPKNPRVIKGEFFDSLKRSIVRFPEMMELRPIVVDEDGVIIGGNMRFEAVKALGMKEIPDSWVTRADNLTEEQKREFVIKDNANFGEWDFDALANEWNDLPLDDWGLAVPDIDFSHLEDEEMKSAPAEREKRVCPNCETEF